MNRLYHQYTALRWYWCICLFFFFFYKFGVVNSQNRVIEHIEIKIWNNIGVPSLHLILTIVSGGYSKIRDWPESFCNAFYIQNIYGCKSVGLFKKWLNFTSGKALIENDQKYIVKCQIADPTQWGKLLYLSLFSLMRIIIKTLYYFSKIYKSIQSSVWWAE